jgi:hypothetical protein
MAKQRFYVVWKVDKPGFWNGEDCKAQTDKFPNLFTNL